MDFHGIQMKGSYFMEEFATKPTWSASDETRVIYTANEDRMYYATSSKWVRPLLANEDDEPDADNTYTLGGPSARFDAIWSVDFEGVARQARYA